MKTCTKCGVTKEIYLFGKHTRAKDGLNNRCMDCCIIASNKYRSENPEKGRLSSAKYRAENIDKLKYKDAKYRAENTEKIRAKNSKYRAENMEKVIASISKYRAENAEKIRDARKKWRSENREMISIAYAKWANENPDKLRIIRNNRRARKLNSGGTISKSLAERLFRLQRGKCPCCGNPLGDDYHLDHIMPLALGGSNTDDNIQLLRARCNIQKHAKHPVDFMRQRGFLI